VENSWMGQTYLTEQTAKRFKALQAIGGAAVLLSLPGCMVAPGLGGGLFFVGALVYSAGRIGGWWHHG